jgi:hypothetical protein
MVPTSTKHLLSVGDNEPDQQKNIIVGCRGPLQGFLSALGLAISSRDMESAHPGRFIRKRKGCSWNSAVEPGNRWFPAKAKAGAFYGHFNSRLG